ncbi:integrase family protein [Mesorhizobium sp. J8]|nr:integrase family protein [Mesorhizobium sp. J8]
MYSGTTVSIMRELYSRKASQVRLAVHGMDRVVRLVTRKPMLDEPVGELPYKVLINNDNGRPGGHIEAIDFIVFSVGQLKPSRCSA